MPQLSLFVDLQNACLVRGFNNAVQAALPNFFQGSTLTIFARFMNPTGNSSSPYVDADQSTATVQMAIGTIGGQPTGGTFTLTDSDATQTTAGIAFNATPSQMQTAIRAALTTNWSLATVAGNQSGPWTITNGANATRSALVLNGGSLTPASQGNVIVQQAGSGAAPAIQFLELQLSPIAYNDTWTPYPSPTVVVAGASTAWTATLNNQPYAGTFTLSVSGIGTTAPIAYNASASTVQAALRLLAGLTATTVGGAAGSYVITFAASQTLTASAAGLIGPLALVGTLSLGTVGVEEAIGEAASISQTFEIKVTPSGGSAQVVTQTGVTILNDLIPNAPAIPTPGATFYTQAQVNALLAALRAADTFAVSAAGSSTLTIPATTMIFTDEVTVGAGSGSYTHTRTLSAANRQAGDKIFLSLAMPASTNPTFDVNNNAGSIIFAAVGTGVASTTLRSFTFGTDWTLDA